MAVNLNDVFLGVLYDYKGSIDDRRIKFLEENFVPRTGNVNDMEFKALELLGYSGSLDDMWAEYLGNLEAGAGLSDKARLLSSTFYTDYYGQYTEYVNGTDYRPVMVVDPDDSDRYLFDCTYKHWVQDLVPAMVVAPDDDYYAIEAYV